MPELVVTEDRLRPVWANKLAQPAIRLARAVRKGKILKILFEPERVSGKLEFECRSDQWRQ